MSRETRTIRPFVGLDKLERTLDQTLLHFGQESCDPGSTLVADVEPREYLLRPVTIAWTSDESAFEQLVGDLRDGAEESGVPLEALSLVAVASTPFLKTTNVVFDHSLSGLESLPRTTTLSEPERPPAFSTPFNGFFLDAYLLLARSLEPRPLSPHVRGTWLARSRFRIETKLAPAILPPTPLTDELRKQLDLLPRAVRYIYFGDHNVLEPYREQEQPVFYVDDQLLAQVNVRRSSSTSKALQMQLANDFVASIVRRAAADADILKGVAFDDVQTSLLGSVIRLAAGPGATVEDRDRLLDLVATDSEKVMARAEHFIGIGEGFLGALKDRDS